MKKNDKNSRKNLHLIKKWNETKVGKLHIIKLAHKMASPSKKNCFADAFCYHVFQVENCIAFIVKFTEKNPNFIVSERNFTERNKKQSKSLTFAIYDHNSLAPKRYSS